MVCWFASQYAIAGRQNTLLEIVMGMHTPIDGN